MVHVAQVINEHGRWADLPYGIRVMLMRNHLWALHQRGVVMLTQEESFDLAKRYAASTGKYPWELLYWRYNGEVGSAVGLCEWECDLIGTEHTLPGIDECFASPNLREAVQRKKEFLAHLCERVAGKGKVIEVGRVHNLFSDQRVRQSVTSDGIRRVVERLRTKIETALERGEHVAVTTFTAATFYDPFDKGDRYLIDPGLVIGNDVLKKLVEDGLSMQSVIVATSLDGVEGLACCGEKLQAMIYKIWEAEYTMYEEYGVEMVELFEYETGDGRVLSMKWPYDYASRTWEEYVEWVSKEEGGFRVLRRALSLMRRSRLAPFPWRLNVFVF